ncbi:MAG: hypothetical protein QOD06_434 [Candidatus Binatota bacterium]|jgi:hypothetical protein|nr:hypothetical protein [Candidatus Binatota bacterium]
MVHPSFVTFVERIVLPANAANPTHHRLDGGTRGGNRTVFGKFRHGQRIWKVHADTWYEPLLAAFARAREGADPFIEGWTRGGTRCLELANVQGLTPRPPNKHLYIYEA